MLKKLMMTAAFAAAAGCATGPGGAQAQDGPPRPNYPVEAEGTSCPRADLTAVADAYSAALAAHDPSQVDLASNVRITENGVEVAPGEGGLWEGAGAWGEENYLIDTERCGTVTFGVLEENGRLVHAAIRLQTNDAGAITEAEHIVGREDEFAYGPDGILETSYLDWERILAPEERQSRAAMAAAATDYFAMFTETPYVSVPFADWCDRWENGAHTTPTHNCSPKGLVINHPSPRTPLVDLEAGIVAGFEHFGGNLEDVHVFKMADGKVHYIMAVVGPQSDTMGWPAE